MAVWNGTVAYHASSSIVEGTLCVCDPIQHGQIFTRLGLRYYEYETDLKSDFFHSQTLPPLLPCPSIPLPRTVLLCVEIETLQLRHNPTHKPTTTYNRKYPTQSASALVLSDQCVLLLCGIEMSDNIYKCAVSGIF